MQTTLPLSDKRNPTQIFYETEDHNDGHLHVTWKGYEDCIVQLAQKIHAEQKVEEELTGKKFDFDQIICVTRGGALVGDIFSRLFKKGGEGIGYICASSYRGDEGKQHAELKISQNIALVTNKIGKKILLVDDLSESGTTLKQIKACIAAIDGVEEVRTAAIWNKKGSDFPSDYWLQEVEKEVWIYQPFEKFDLMDIDQL